MARIVVLEDEPGISALLRDALRSEGHDVICLSHPSQMDSMLLVTKPDLFLIDLMLPTVDGIDVARSLQDGRLDGVPMIALSASVLRTHMAERSGLFDAAIRKPFDLGVLAGYIDRCLAARRAGTDSQGVRKSIAS